ncbi:hypothetical protein FHS85_001112 [Rhodoligotrophos appendicifer]|uniref:copper chaperone PCu(A)C n=1 Tax=Rhodoligotrophos appendicifer TaxID=987056 RepID=UPI001184809A|nr:copper chaperone PCu(A)C [Rhodoligotrophos appendicifer]
MTPTRRTATLSIAAGLLCLSTFGAFAHGTKLGDIEVENPWVRATPVGAPSGGGYVVIINTGDTADRLLSATLETAGQTEIHEMSMNNGVMKMRALPNGLELAPKSKVVLKPGGYHLMFLELKQPIQEGEPLPGTLTFEKAGTLKVQFQVEPIGSAGPSHDH